MAFLCFLPLSTVQEPLACECSGAHFPLVTGACPFSPTHPTPQKPASTEPWSSPTAFLCPRRPAPGEHVSVSVRSRVSYWACLESQHTGHHSERVY